MDDIREYKIKRKLKAKKLVNDVVSFFENEYGIKTDPSGDFLIETEPDEQIIYNWDGSVLRDLNQKEGV